MIFHNQIARYINNFYTSQLLTVPYCKNCSTNNIICNNMYSLLAALCNMHRRSAHRGQGGPGPPPPVFFIWKRWYFSFRLASLNRNCVQYYNTTSVLYSVHYENCNVRVSLQIQYMYVQMFLLSLYVRYTHCTTYAVSVCIPIIVYSY